MLASASTHPHPAQASRTALLHVAHQVLEAALEFDACGLHHGDYKPPNFLLRTSASGLMEVHVADLGGAAIKDRDTGRAAALW